MEELRTPFHWEGPGAGSAKAFISQEPPQELVCNAKKALNINIYNKKTNCISVSHRIEANISETDEGVLRTRPS